MRRAASPRQMRPTAGSSPPIRATAARTAPTRLCLHPARQYRPAVDLIARSLSVNRVNPPALVNHRQRTTGRSARATQASGAAFKGDSATASSSRRTTTSASPDLALAQRDAPAPARPFRQRPHSYRRLTISSAIFCAARAAFGKAGNAEKRWSCGRFRRSALGRWRSRDCRRRTRPARIRRAREPRFTSGLEGLERWFEPARAATGAVARRRGAATPRLPGGAQSGVARTPRQVGARG